VGRGTNLTATFSEKMTASTVNASTFKLYKVNLDQRASTPPGAAFVAQAQSIGRAHNI
jgi:hypothetical protein